METLYSTRFVDVAYMPEKSCLIQTWKGFCTSEDFRAAQKKTVELFVEKRCKNFISDTTNASLLKKEETDWVSEVITPQLVKAGMVRLNMVLPASAFTKMTLMNLEKAEGASGNADIKMFGSLESALAEI
ncbi:hypothetical protein [Acetobacteroides hydrogenigenes]|uniref:Uncharacterized protein n=1 Tax=Acetobacteroides hydrogenigenes TaxID=979970 RepID=A0A4R2EW61_9BACT|nr:hypothetical protein [Acetobacteroides hydrogenigenes]TCN72926.1 hypothetical protein CLV25_101144 [Acetobacteroides hydrogenigenes]